MDLALGLGAASGLVKEKRGKRGHGNWEQIMGVKCQAEQRLHFEGTREPCRVLSRGGQGIAGCR